MGKTNLKRLVCVILALMMLYSTVVMAAAQSVSLTSTTGSNALENSTSDVQSEVSNMSDVLEIMEALTYEEYLAKYADVPSATKELVIDATQYNEETTDAEVSIYEAGYDGAEGASLFTPDTGTVEWSFEVPADGMYAIKIVYYPVEGKATSVERNFKIDGKLPFKETRSLNFTKIWTEQYDEAFINTDRKFKIDGLGGTVVDENGNIVYKGNEVRPAMIQAPEWTIGYFRDVTGEYIEPFEYMFTKGEHTIQLIGARESMLIEKIILYPLVNAPTYAEKLEEYRQNGIQEVSGMEPIKIQAEYPSITSEQILYPSYDRTSSITEPQDPTYIRLNTIGGSNWSGVGQWIEWEVDVPQAGLYEIAMRYLQNVNEGLYSCRRIYINGEQQFYESNYLQFKYRDDWQVSTIGDENGSYLFYFEEGKNTIRLEVTLGTMGDLLRRVSESLDTINSDYLKILMITGAEPDEYRDYNFSKLIPETIRSLLMESKELYSVADQLVEISGARGSQVATLSNVAQLLETMGSDEYKIASNMENLKTQIGTLGTWLSGARSHSMKVDYILIQPKETELPASNSNFFQMLWFEIQGFFASFVTDYNAVSSTDGNFTHSVEYWVATGRDQAQILRNLIDNEFIPYSNGINVDLKLITAGTVLPAVLAGIGPDVALSSSSETINFALRGAVKPLNDFEGFDEVMTWFDDSATVPLTLYGTTYGIPLTQNFYMMFYRKDILADLGIEIPKTWQDLLDVMPTLQNNYMEVAMPISLAGAQIFLYQMGGELYGENGLTIGLDTNEALDAFSQLTSLFQEYSFPVAYDFPNRFRTGEMPIGIVDYTTYNQMQLFATELAGLWEFTVLPGFEMTDENGNTYINNCSTSTIGDMIMLSSCEEENEAATWEFMKWYASADVQAKYSNEMVALLGPSGQQAVANKEALAELPWTTQEYKNLEAQFENLVAVPEYPGGYIITRYVDFAFYSVVNENADPVESMLGYVDDINREITRKRTEFYEVLSELMGTDDEKVVLGE